MKSNPMNPRPVASAEKLAALTTQRQEAVEKIAWLKRLTENQDFRRFMQVVAEWETADRTKAEDIEGRTTKQRDVYSQRHIRLRKLMEWPGATHAELAQVIVGLEEQIDHGPGREKPPAQAT